jgi:hypothetical protein
MAQDSVQNDSAEVGLEFGRCDDCNFRYWVAGSDHDPETGLCNRCARNRVMYPEFYSW